MKSLLIIFITAFLIGCAQAPKKTSTFSETKIDIPDEKSAVVVVYRKMVPPIIFPVSTTMNEKPFATLPNNSFTWAKIAPGEYKLKFSWPLLAATPGETKNLTIEAGKYYFVEFGGSTRIGYSGIGPVGYNTHNVEIHDSNLGLKSVMDCCKYIPSQF